MQFLVNGFHNNTLAWYNAETVDWETFTLTLFSFKGYQETVPETITLAWDQEFKIYDSDPYKLLKVQLLQCIKDCFKEFGGTVYKVNIKP